MVTWNHIIQDNEFVFVKKCRFENRVSSEKCYFFKKINKSHLFWFLSNQIRYLIQRQQSVKNAREIIIYIDPNCHRSFLLHELCSALRESNPSAKNRNPGQMVTLWGWFYDDRYRAKYFTQIFSPPSKLPINIYGYRVILQLLGPCSKANWCTFSVDRMFVCLSVTPPVSGRLPDHYS